MKYFMFIFLSLFILSLKAGVCFEATNVEGVTISSDSREEQAKSISLELSLVEKTPWATFNVLGQSLKFQTVAIGGYLPSKGLYGVECDGGQVEIRLNNQGALIESDFLAGDVFSRDEGCSTGALSFSGPVQLTEVQCLK